MIAEVAKVSRLTVSAKGCLREQSQRVYLRLSAAHVLLAWRYGAQGEAGGAVEPPGEAVAGGEDSGGRGLGVNAKSARICPRMKRGRGGLSRG